MRQVTLKAEKREKTGKETAKKLRKMGYIPAVLYGKALEPQSFAVSYSEFEKIYNRFKGEAVIYTLEFADGEGQRRQAVLKEFQRHPVSDRFIHLDFQAIEEGETLELEVPIEFVGKPVGVTKGGILEIMIHELTVECLPKDIPDKIVVDISSLDIGDSLHVRDVKVASNIKIKDHPEETIATVVAEEEEAPAAETTTS
ncbi:MAG: 50S ribosomal protein L25/general stress protein Ctc [Caldimicrobium sp.]|nr:50S ribosomal protein L25/general stress protein Ctc [Caldimicrobium sp.]MCX7612974.1 50S ribosomal protein L25/general stress protein Ctc [Caldimicrobium sp.]MDW8183213.1 50S ribosomal protein L25/general stress protein Ctc [Caldimicrobium sp.]